MKDFHGFPIDVIENDQLRLEYLATAGPRIVRLSYKGSPNLMADIHQITWETPHGEYRPLGGHRLWTAPESFARTYIPDGSGLQVRKYPTGVELAGAVEPGSGVQKSLRIELEANRPVVQLLHTIVNKSLAPITLAPWTITMFIPGGVAILPQPEGNVDPDGVLSNRTLVLWPYTRINDPRLHLADDFITVQAAPDKRPFKIGYYNPHGWIGYWREGIFFVKRNEPQPEATFPDGGSNTELYCNHIGVELEALAPLRQLNPGQFCCFAETWELYDNLEQPFLKGWHPGQAGEAPQKKGRKLGKLD